MSEETPAVQHDSYATQTRRPLNNLAMVLPLLLFFQVGAAWYGSDMALLAPQYLGAVLRFFGATATFLPPVMIVAVLLIQHIAHKEPWTVQPPAVAGMVGEAILWTIPLIALGYMTGKLGGAAVAPDADTMQKVLKAFGAGIYEEFIFRMVAISLILLLLVDVLRLRKDATAVAAVLAAAVVFSLCHFKFMHGGDDFTWNTFIFRSVAGVLWGAMFIFRGFGIAVGGHIVWDLYVFLGA